MKIQNFEILKFWIFIHFFIEKKFDKKSNIFGPKKKFDQTFSIFFDDFFSTNFFSSTYFDPKFAEDSKNRT